MFLFSPAASAPRPPRGAAGGWPAPAARRLTSFCTGSLLLAGAGLLAGRRATTHWGALDLLGQLDPTIRVEREARVVDDGIISSAGVSAGIDMALAVVELMHGRPVADETARYMDYVRIDRRELPLGSGA